MRIFSIPKGEKLFSYKRGVASAYIYSMNFSFDNEKLVITSDTGTLHIFDLKNDKDETKNKSSGKLSQFNSKGVFYGFFSKVFTTVSQTILPKDYEDYYGIQYVVNFKKAQLDQFFLIHQSQ